MTPQQLATLKAAILADPSAEAFYTNGDLSGLAEYLNTDANPAFVIWRDSVAQDEITQNGFDWVRVDNLSVGKARIWDWLFKNLATSIDPSKTNVRAGIDEVWKGTAADLAVRAAVYTHCKRNASRFEKVFATGVGATDNPATAALVGPISYTELIGL